MTIALCHEWTLTLAGSEKVARRLAGLLDPEAVYTWAAEEDVARTVFPGRIVHTSRLGRTTLGRAKHAWFLPVMAAWWRRLDLSSYDMIVTSSHAVVNAVRPRRGASLVSYCYTPMRYAWLWRSEVGRFPRPVRWVWPAVAAILRRADRRRARRVDLFIADSTAVAERIERFYGRSSTIVPPPVDTEFFTPGPHRGGGDPYFLFAGRLVAYKRPDIAVEAANRAGVRLVVAGSGPETRRLREMAGPTVDFRPSPSDEELRELYRGASALVFPGTEDFGIVMVEAQACGTPVIAFDDGGVRDSVAPGVTGVLYDDPSADRLAAELAAFTAERFDPTAIRANAERFAPERFDAAIRTALDRCAAEHRSVS